MFTYYNHYGSVTRNANVVCPRDARAIEVLRGETHFSVLGSKARAGELTGGTRRDRDRFTDTSSCETQALAYAMAACGHSRHSVRGPPTSSLGKPAFFDELLFVSLALIVQHLAVRPLDAHHPLVCPPALVVLQIAV